MNILLFTQYFWPESFGINALTRSLKRGGADVTVLTGKPNYPEGRVFEGYSGWGINHEHHEGVEILRLPLISRGQRSSIRLLLNYISFIMSGLVLGPPLLRKRAVDIVFVYAPSPLLQALAAIWLAQIKRAPMVLWVQDLWPESLSATGLLKNRVALRIVGRLVRFIYLHTDLILVPSEAFRAPISKLTHGRVNIGYYPNACVDDPPPNSPDAATKALATRIASGFSVVFAGNLGTAQSLESVIQAAELLQDAGEKVRFFLIGSGSMSGWLTTQIASKSLNNVEVPGRFPPSAMPQLYAAASALLVCLRDDRIFELTIPSKLQSYLAAGRPIIAALNGEGARVVKAAGAGVTCAAGDPGALAEAVLFLARLPDQTRYQMGKDARRYAATHFSLDTLATDLLRRLEELVATHASKSWEKNQ